jgi:hypothetical protein
VTERTELVPVTEGNPHPLGRHVRHDERSKAYPAALAATYKQVWWSHRGPALDQGSVGSCTGHALVDALMTGPLYRPGRTLTHDDALRAYERATQIDPFPGQFPPTDTGSDGIDVCKAGVEFGWLKGYTHAFGLDACLRALSLQPVMIGIPWYRDMFTPGKDGVLKVSGPLAGGHEGVLTANTGSGLVRFQNSWGSRWGITGYAYLRIADLGNLLSQQGDVTVPVSV